MCNWIEFLPEEIEEEIFDKLDDSLSYGFCENCIEKDCSSCEKIFLMVELLDKK